MWPVIWSLYLSVTIEEKLAWTEIIHISTPFLTSPQYTVTPEYKLLDKKLIFTDNNLNAKLQRYRLNLEHISQTQQIYWEGSCEVATVKNSVT